MKTNNIAINEMYPSINRAVKIAAIGGFSLTLYFEDMYDFKPAIDDCGLISDFYKPVFKNFKDDRADIAVELIRIAPHHYSSEKIDDIKQQIFEAKKRNKKREISGSAQVILSTAAEKCHLSIKQQNTVVKIAEAVCNLDNNDLIDAASIAEAVVYVNHNHSSDYFNCFSQCVQIGSGISIDERLIDKSSVVSAINFLTLKLQTYEGAF